MTAKPPHPFQADPDVPPDHHGRAFCRHCGKVDIPDDPRHTMPDVAAQGEHRRRVGDDG